MFNFVQIIYVDDKRKARLVFLTPAKNVLKKKVSPMLFQNNKKTIPCFLIMYAVASKLRPMA